MLKSTMRTRQGFEQHGLRVAICFEKVLNILKRERSCLNAVINHNSRVIKTPHFSSKTCWRNKSSRVGSDSKHPEQHVLWNSNSSIQLVGVKTNTSNLGTYSGFSTVAKNKVDFGILFDVDGVLARGSTPLDSAKKAMDKLKDSEGNLKVPVAFVTNACNRSADKARQISNWFDIKVPSEQVIHAPTPAKLLRQFHDKHTLVIGQEHRLDIANDLGFSNVCTIEDIKDAYPLLDMVDHDNRIRIAKGDYTENPNFPKVDVILLIGEPCRWETDLQLIIDLLMTEGKPNLAPCDPHTVTQLPIIACNMDLVFMAEASLPRFGHGAFLLCLETLYQKITGRPLCYQNLVGKPCEITYRFAEHTVSKIARKMGFTKPLKRLYFFGDNPSVDIVGANLYNRYIKKRDSNGNACELPLSRLIPLSAELHEQTVEDCHSMLVGTGVYKHKPEEKTDQPSKTMVYHGHRDIAHEEDLSKPHKYVHDVHEGIEYIFTRENVSY